ncbi:hypothetical protein HYN48_09045 [Flavobacterium magnum]|uniref:Uncharacterized protein n=1 Tax=Flavobacterium magnum TaxID=2162713 RepID=A0A2S0REZ0_9FLAO|nr:hypothetical protein HYN48_09045 [Flavobacterium magnum]
MMSERRSEDAFKTFYHRDAKQIEYPNLVTKNVAVRTLEDLKAGSERGALWAKCGKRQLVFLSRNIPDPDS